MFHLKSNTLAMTLNNMLGFSGSFNTDYSFYFSGEIFNSITGNIVVQIDNYIDFTINETYTYTSEVSHNFTAIGHVKRDL